MFVQPSGLVFLVIIAIWATYLLQHWVRRREHLATARSVDRFSDAMRVLERRLPVPELELASPQPRSYAVSPARPSGSEAVVKRAQHPAANVPTRPAGAVRATPTFHALAGVSARRVQGLSLLLSLSLAAAAPPLAALSVLSWWSIAVAGAVLIADFAWLRHAAVAQRASRRARASVRTRTAVRRTAPPASSTAPSAMKPAARPLAQSESVVEAPADGVAEIARPTTAPAEADLSGWAPVPVPPPTYTLKAKAERPEPAPAAVAGPAPVAASSFDGLIDDDELDGLLDRRAAGA